MDIQCRQLTMRFGRVRANDHIDLDIEHGEIYGLVGRNGSGKTTLIRQWSGSLIPTEGTIRFFDSPKLDLGRRRIGFSGDSSYFYHLSGRANLEYFATLKGVRDKGQIPELMKHWDLDPADKKKVSQYSMGMKQKLSIAGAMLGEPEVLVMDEPINGLDPVSINHFRETMLKLNREKGTTIFVSSHILSELSMMCTRFGILEQGRLIEELSREELHDKARSTLRFATTDHTAAARLLRAQPFGSQLREDGRLFRLPPESIEPGELSRLLAESGIYLTELVNEERTLEDYYIATIRQAQIDYAAEGDADAASQLKQIMQNGGR